MDKYFSNKGGFSRNSKHYGVERGWNTHVGLYFVEFSFLNRKE